MWRPLYIKYPVAVGRKHSKSLVCREVLLALINSTVLKMCGMILPLDYSYPWRKVSITFLPGWEVWGQLPVIFQLCSPNAESNLALETELALLIEVNSDPVWTGFSLGSLSSTTGGWAVSVNVVCFFSRHDHKMRNKSLSQAPKDAHFRQ